MGEETTSLKRKKNENCNFILWIGKWKIWEQRP